MMIAKILNLSAQSTPKNENTICETTVKEKSRMNKIDIITYLVLTSILNNAPNPSNGNESVLIPNNEK